MTPLPGNDKDRLDAIVLANIAVPPTASTLVGRGSSQGDGPAESITLGANLLMTGTVLSATGGGGGATISQVEANLGASPTKAGRFTLIDAAITPASKVAIWQAPGPYTGKGTLADEAEMDPLWCVAVPGSGQAVVRWRTTEGAMPTLDAGAGSTNPSVQNAVLPRPGWSMRVRGYVKGNYKFFYLIG